MPQRYKIFYTSTAERDITEKLMYIMQQYRDTALAERWYNRLRALIQENLTAFPAKYPLYDVGRTFVRTGKNTTILQPERNIYGNYRSG